MHLPARWRKALLAVHVATTVSVLGADLALLTLAISGGRLGPIAMLTTLVAGMWMMAQVWGHQPWIVSAFVGLVGMAALGGVISLRGARRLRVALAGETGPALSDALRE
jgi:hypothetical protein